MKKTIKSLVRCVMLNVFSQKQQPIFYKDMEKDFRNIYLHCQESTMTSLESMYSLYKATEYVSKGEIPGDIVECGVWKGGSAMLIAETLHSFKDVGRKIYLYDTFEGMPQPDDIDIKIRTGVSGKIMWEEKQKTGGWAKAPLDEVKDNMSKTSFPQEQIIFIKGKVEETIPQIIPNSIAILRLDTDWFSSTYHELEHLYPLISPGGVIIIDDYGSWAGSKKATDQYFAEQNITMCMHRIGTGRISVKR